MFLAGILALWMLSGVPCLGSPSGAAVPTVLQTTTPSGQQSSAPSPPPPDSQEPPKSAAPKSTTPPKHKTKKKAPPPPPADSTTTPPKKVVPHGGTEDPTTHLTPSITDEQSAKSKSANSDALSQAEANLQKVTTRPLTSEQQETADQVKKFVEQSRAADKEGDLQRASTLANKAKLLSDSLEETSRPK